MNLVEFETPIVYGNRGSLCTAHIADIHFGAFDPKTQYQILEEQFINRIIELPLDAVFINGDLFDHRAMANSDLIMYAIKFVDTLIQKIIIPKRATLTVLLGTYGHDADQLKLFYHYINNPNIDIRIVESIRFEYIRGSKVLCIPESANISEETYNKYLFESGWYDMCVMHGTLDSAGYQASNNCRLFTIKDFILCRGPIISGHIHNGGCFNKYFYYSGSPYSWSFADDYRKGFFICLQNLDTGWHYIHKELIKSFRYETVNLDDILDNDPKVVIEYINRIKEEKGIDYIRVEFNKEIEDDMKYIFDSYYKNNSTVKMKYNFTKENKYIRDRLQEMDQLEQYSYIYDNSLTEYDKLARYINDNMGYIYISAEDIKKLVEEEYC